jgi:hypothetical protein
LKEKTMTKLGRAVRRIVSIFLGALMFMETSALAGDRSGLRWAGDPSHPAITYLSWDTEGGERVKTNLLQPGSSVKLRLKVDGQWLDGDKVETRVFQGKMMRYRLVAGGAIMDFEIRSSGKDLNVTLKGSGKGIEAAELIFPFDPRVASTTILPSIWQEDGSFKLPGVINAPDFGPLVVREAKNREVRGRLEGSREKKIVNLILELPRIFEG